MTVPMTAARDKWGWNPAMLRIAWKLLAGDRAKYAGLLFGISFTSFLVTFAASYFCGFMTRSFALIAENPTIDIWVMAPTVGAVDQTMNMPGSALDRVRSVTGVQSAASLAIGTADVHFPNGRFLQFQIIGVDDASLTGAPQVTGGVGRNVLRSPDAVVVDSGGTSGKLQTPELVEDQWPRGGPHLDAPTRSLRSGDELLINDRRVLVKGRSMALPRYPPRPLIYTSYSNASRILLPERHRLTYVLVTAEPGVDTTVLAARIQKKTGLNARTSHDFEVDTVWWVLANSEDVGDIASMITMAMSVGFGVTGVMFYMFTNEHLKQYAVLKAMGATSRLLLAMIFVQAGLCALLGTGLGLGLCVIIGHIVATEADYPFRMMWFTPLVGGGMVILVSLVAALISARPVLKLQPGVVFAGR